MVVYTFKLVIFLVKLRKSMSWAMNKTEYLRDT